eukprot:Nk52_evm2s265 gene=Nk52_evmTU2s265
MTKKSVVFIFALCALCTFSGPFHGSAEPIPSDEEDKAVEVEMTDMSSGLLLGSGIENGIQLQSFRKEAKKVTCVYSIWKNYDEIRKYHDECNIYKPNTAVECVVERSSIKESGCPGVINKKIKVMYTNHPHDDSVHTVGSIHIGNVGIKTFPKSFDSELVKFSEVLEALKRFNGYEIDVALHDSPPIY